MEEGHIYEFNNTIKHSVENKGDKRRIHLIIDYCDAGEFDEKYDKYKKRFGVK